MENLHFIVLYTLLRYNGPGINAESFNIMDEQVGKILHRKLDEFTRIDTEAVEILFKVTSKVEMNCVSNDVTGDCFLRKGKFIVNVF